MSSKNNNKVIFHIDVNSAYLSWEAVYRLQHGGKVDLRKVPAVVGGDPKTRHGIVLAKSIPAKKYGIKTGETLYTSCRKCPNLTIVPPRYELYMKCSNALFDILRTYSPKAQRFSVDECFIDMTNMEHIYGDPVKLAYNIKNRIHKELGFTVNIGISKNKLLAKVASDFKKPNMVHTLFPKEIEEKMWPMPIENLYMVGAATAPKLKRIGILTIGDLAKADLTYIKHKLKSHGETIWNYANGIEISNVRMENYVKRRGLGNSTTIPFDVKDRDTAHMILLSITEMVAMRLRNIGCSCKVVSVKIKTNEFIRYSHQRKLFSETDCTNRIYSVAKELFNEIWKGEPIRHIGVRASEISETKDYQRTFFDDENLEKNKALDKAIDDIRFRFGKDAVIRSTFLNTKIKPLTGGIGEEDYPMMSSLL